MGNRQKRICIDSIMYDDRKMEEYLANVGRRIREERMNRNLSISKLAELANLSSSCISKAESDHCRISLKALLKIAAALDIPVAALVQKDMQTEIREVEMETRPKNLSPEGERFEQIIENAEEETVLFVLEVANELMRVLERQRKADK